MSIYCDHTLAMCAYQIALCTTEAMFYKELKYLGVAHGSWPPYLASEHCSASVHEVVDKHGDKFAIVCIREKIDKPAIEVAGLLVHESVHIWQWHCENIGEDEPGKEQEAYAIQSISQSLMMAYVAQKGL